MKQRKWIGVMVCWLGFAVIGCTVKQQENVLGAVGTFLGVPNLSNQLRTDVPGLRCWYPVPMESSKFTIVMSPFVTVNPEGNVRTTGDGRELARLLYDRLENSFEGLDLAIPYELRSPDQSCPIKGSNREERAAAAEEAAQFHSALAAKARGVESPERAGEARGGREAHG